jgi:hypothetical protein
MKVLDETIFQALSSDHSSVEVSIPRICRICGDTTHLQQRGGHRGLIIAPQHSA